VWLTDEHAPVDPFNNRLGNPQRYIAPATTPRLTSLYLQHSRFVTENSNYRARAELPIHREFFGRVMGLNSWGTNRKFIDCRITISWSLGDWSIHPCRNFFVASDGV
jgi:hypothetical protein